MSNHQTSTTQWLPVTSDYHTIDIASLESGCNDPNLEDPIFSLTGPSWTYQGDHIASGTTYTTGRKASWAATRLDEGYSQLFPISQKVYQCEPFQTHTRPSVPEHGSDLSQTPTSANSALSTDHQMETRSYSNRTTSKQAQDAIQDYYLPNTTDQQHVLNTSLLHFLVSPSSQHIPSPIGDFQLAATAHSNIETREAGDSLISTTLQNWASMTLPLSKSHLLGSTPLGASSSQSKDSFPYGSFSYPVSDTYEAPISPPWAVPLQQSPLPPRAVGSGSAKDAAASEPKALQCTFKGCTSKMTFTRQCDLGKHYRQHFRRYSCRVERCVASAGFATKKDRARHEQTHNPSILCKHCGRKFSRQDNLRDHVRRRH